MGSSLVGSTNQAEAFTADMEGQTIEIDGNTADVTKGLLLVAPDGGKWKLIVANDGTVDSATA